MRNLALSVCLALAVGGCGNTDTTDFGSGGTSALDAAAGAAAGSAGQGGISGAGGVSTSSGGRATAAGGGGASPSSGGRATAAGGAGSGGTIGGTGGKGGAVGSSGGAAGAGGCQAGPVDLYLMYQRSLSMGCPTEVGTRWTMMKAGTQAFLSSSGAVGTGVGLGYFGDGTIALNCTPSSYETPAVEIGPLPANGAALAQSLDDLFPIGTAPSAAALTAGLTHASAWKAAHAGKPVALVFVTSGEPSCGTMDDAAQAAAAELKRSGIRTYVLGVMYSRSSCTRDNAPPVKDDFDRIARAGGTSAAHMIEGDSDAPNKIALAYSDIQANAACP